MAVEDWVGATMAVDKMHRSNRRVHHS